MTPNRPNQCNQSIDYFVIFDCGLFILAAALPHTFKEKLKQVGHISAFWVATLGARGIWQKKQKPLSVFNHF